LSDDRASHWEAAYTSKQAEEQSWFQQTPNPSLEAIGRIGGQRDHSLIDVGAGSSSHTARLSEQGWDDLTALDISPAALERARAKAGKHAQNISWINADITRWQPERKYDIWHDRAVFHFLTEAEDRGQYKTALMAGLKPGGHVILATFAADGPENCSGLPVCRYDAAEMAMELGDAFEPVADWQELHLTLFGTKQTFQWCVFRLAV